MWRLYDYLNGAGKNEFAAWTRALQKRERIKLAFKLDMLEQVGPNLPPQLLAGPICDHIYKLKVQGAVKLRPLLCKGPVDNEGEFTLLIGAKEVQGELKPNGVENRAGENRQEIIANPLRRCCHEKID